MEILITAFGSFIGTSLALLLFRQPTPAPTAAAAHVVKKLGPSLYTTESKRKPKGKTDEERWKEEQGQNL